MVSPEWYNVDLVPFLSSVHKPVPTQDLLVLPCLLQVSLSCCPLPFTLPEGEPLTLILRAHFTHSSLLMSRMQAPDKPRTIICIVRTGLGSMQIWRESPAPYIHDTLLPRYSGPNLTKSLTKVSHQLLSIHSSPPARNSQYYPPLTRVCLSHGNYNWLSIICLNAQYSNISIRLLQPPVKKTKKHISKSKQYL